jgi:tetratricopeptide (TPR) repeat protein
MSLVNVGVELASKGRRVLLVDFDLEAPGIPTFDLFSGLTDAPGVVDYVTEYLTTSRAPDVKEFITQCTSWESPAGGELWLMSAGRQDPSYAARFHAIEWQDLYANREGFLMFEDLKAQWRDAVPGGLDYVLIDSRTGHTDVGGICTRQLPEAVVIMFFPNEQNLRGLGKVITDIRGEYTSLRHKRIQLHFVASNIPDLDDEESILQSQLERSRQLLNYSEDETTILHHYNSLSLLKQDVFVLDREKSKLSREYRSLTNAIVSANSEDREGAINTLSKMLFALSRPPREVNFQMAELEGKLSELARAHESDSEILYRIAALKERMGAPEDALSILDEAVKSGMTSPQVFARRSHLYRLLGQPEEALADAKKVLEASDVARMDLLNAVRVVSAHGGDYLKAVDASPAIQRQDAETQMRVAQELMANLEGLPAAERLLLAISEDESADPENKRAVQNCLSLCLIAQEKYDEAMASISEKRLPADQFEDIRDAFNYAMAEWGKTESPPLDLFSRVVELGKLSKLQGANYLQCMAIANFVVDDKDNAQEYYRRALREIRVNPGRNFSAWRYLEASPTEFRNDLEDIKEMIDGKALSPLFIRRSKDLFSSLR